MDLTIKLGTNQFYIGDSEAEAIARTTWVVHGDEVLICDHTFVDPSLRGKGIAAKLTDRLVAYTREQGFKLVPECPYVAKVMDRSPEAYADVRVALD
jgi:predicted GNAT family acetyltransferase